MFAILLFKQICRPMPVYGGASVVLCRLGRWWSSACVGRLGPRRCPAAAPHALRSLTQAAGRRYSPLASQVRCSWLAVLPSHAHM